MTKEQAQEIVSNFLFGKYELIYEWEFIENKETAEYGIQQEIKDTDQVFLTFPALKDYQDAKERYNNDKSKENLLILEEFSDVDFENLYDYTNPLYITVDSYIFEIKNGVII